MKLRDYQIAAVDALYNFVKNKEGHPIVAMPTGTGKSPCIAAFIKRMLLEDNSTRVLKLTHSKVLIKQNAETLKTLWPQAPLGICSAGLNQRDLHFPITYGGVATLNNYDLKVLGKVNYLIIDECHLLSPADETMYQSIIERLKQSSPDLRVVGFTATPFRVGQGMLTDSGLFTDICIDMTTREAFNWFIAQGYLTRLVPKKTAFEFDLSNVHTQAGEFNNKELQATVDQLEITRKALREAITLGANRKHWVVFAAGVTHSINVTKELNRMGISARVVHSKMKGEEVELTIAAFKKGLFTAIVNNGILTTGVDAPHIDLVVMLRPTKSAGLWVQMLGRATRPVYAPGLPLDTAEQRLHAIATGPKPNALVLDYAQNTARLGPVNDPVLPKKKGTRGGQPAPVKVCPICATYLHNSVMVCPECAYEFPKFVKIGQTASTHELVAAAKPVAPAIVPEVIFATVDKTVYRQHHKEGRPPCVRVQHYCGLQTYAEYLCFEHPEIYPKRKARAWWINNTDTVPPATTDEFFARLKELRTPRRIRVLLGKKYPDVLEVYYDNENRSALGVAS